MVSKTVDPTFARHFDWALTKDVDQTSVVTDAATATFTYTVRVTKSAAVDQDYRVTGTISVVNPNTYAISGATVTDEVSNGGTCVVANGTGRTIPARGTLNVDYTCTWAGRSDRAERRQPRDGRVPALRLRRCRRRAPAPRSPRP